MEILTNIVNAVNSFFWDYVLLVLLCGTGIFFTFRLRFIQIRKFKEGLKHLKDGMNLNGEKAGDKGMSSFQALTTAVAAQVGTGNIAGAATAIVAGGPGAIFWMWVSAFFGMATIYSEAVLAQKYKTKINNRVTGGPSYYIREAFKGKFGKFLSVFFSLAIILALGFMGNMVQSNSISIAFTQAFNSPPIFVGIAVAILAAFVFIGGTQRIASVTEKVVPVMAIFYSIGCLVILLLNIPSTAQALKQIFSFAFTSSSIAGGAAGIGVQKAMRFGIARGLFSNEAGMGSTPHAHAIAKVKKPEYQGYIAIIGVFIDTFIVLTLTALVIISTGLWNKGETGVALAQQAFSQTYGQFGIIFIAVCMLFFAFSTIIGWYFFGKINVEALFGKEKIKYYSLFVVIFIILGSIMKVDLIWNMADMFNGLMVIPNLLALLALSSNVSKHSK